MKILMMVLVMGLMGCESTPMKEQTFSSSKNFPAGNYSFVKKGYNFNGVKLCFYMDGAREIKIPSNTLDKWSAGRCPISISMI